MKKLLISCICLLPLANQTFAQEESLKRNELAVGYGLVSTSSVISIFSDVLATAITGGGYSKTNSNWSGNFTAAYKFAPTKRFSVGLTYAHTKNTADIAIRDIPSGTSTTNYNTIAGEFQVNYISKSYFRIYGTFGAGLTRYTEKYEPKVGSTETNSASHFNFQVTPIGVKVGNAIGFYAEAGFGYKGIINAGLYVRM